METNELQSNVGGSVFRRTNMGRVAISMLDTHQ